MTSEFTSLCIADVAFETSERYGTGAQPLPVFGVQKEIGLTPEARYTSKDLSRYKCIRPGDFAYNPMRLNIGSIGMCKPEHGRALVSPDYVTFRLSSRVLPRFFNYLISTPQWSAWTSQAGTGSVRSRIYFSQLGTMKIRIPSLEDQATIVSMLDQLEAGICNLAETNATLEAIANALFKSWFIDFDPVHVKAEGCTPAGIDEVTAALFPDSFEESALGAIPKGWTIDEVGNVADCVGGSTPSTKEEAFWEPGIHHWVTPKDLSGLGSPVLLDTERKVSQLGLQKVSSGLLPKGTLLLSSRAPIGYLALAQIPLAVNQGFIAMKPGGRLPPEYLYFWTSSAMDEIKQKANGSTFMEISKSAFRPIKLVVPEPRIVEAFRDIAGTVFEAIEANESERRTLTTLRDTLLPRLISGTLKLPELQEVAEAL